MRDGVFSVYQYSSFESDKVKENLYEIIYWAILATSSIISGMMITVILMLYIAIRDLISIIGLGENNPMISKQEDNEKK